MLVLVVGGGALGVHDLVFDAQGGGVVGLFHDAVFQAAVAILGDFEIEAQFKVVKSFIGGDVTAAAARLVMEGAFVDIPAGGQGLAAKLAPAFGGAVK